MSGEGDGAWRGFAPFTQPVRSECPLARARTALERAATLSQSFQLSPVIPKREMLATSPDSAAGTFSQKATLSVMIPGNTCVGFATLREDLSIRANRP